MTEKVYARVVDGKIVETDIMGYQIINRGHPFEMYHEAVEGIKPFTTSYQRLNKNWVIVGNTVEIQYTAVDMGIQELLNLVNASVTDPQETVNIETIDKDLIRAVIHQAQVYAQEQLDKFAQSALYDNMLSLASYATSKNEKRRKEAQRGIDLRDAYWDYLISLEERILTGQVGVPKNQEQILSQLPALTWEE